MKGRLTRLCIAPESLSKPKEKNKGNTDVILCPGFGSRFLYELSQIPDFAGRAHCIIFRSAFIDGVMSIRRKLNTVSAVCRVRGAIGQTACPDFPFLRVFHFVAVFCCGWCC